MTNLYSLLGINKTDDKNIIKKAYKKAALKWHPDRNMNNKEEAEKKFKEISEAYDILSDESKKNLYDTHGIEAVRQMGSGMPENPFDIFENLFGGGGGPFGGNPFGGGGGPFGGFSGNPFSRQNGRSRSKDRVENIKISLEDVYNQNKINLKLKKREKCINCDGTGGKEKQSSFIHCTMCDGSGVILKVRQLGPGMISQQQEMCSKCNGKGKELKPNHKCLKCNGLCYNNVVKELNIEIERGIKDKQKIIIKNESHYEPNCDEIGD